MRVSVARVDAATAGLHAVARTLAAEARHSRQRRSRRSRVVALVRAARACTCQPLGARPRRSAVADLRSVRGDDGRQGARPGTRRGAGGAMVAGAAPL